MRSPRISVSAYPSNLGYSFKVAGYSAVKPNFGLRIWSNEDLGLKWSSEPSTILDGSAVRQISAWAWTWIIGTVVKYLKGEIMTAGIFHHRQERPDFKVTVDLQGCLPKNHWHARLLCYNHRKVYIIVKLIKFRIRRNNFFWIWFNSKRVQAFKRKIDTIC